MNDPTDKCVRLELAPHSITSHGNKVLSWPSFAYKWDSLSFIRKNPCVYCLGRSAIHLLQVVSALDYVGGNHTDLPGFYKLLTQLTARMGDCYLMFVRALTL